MSARKFEVTCRVGPLTDREVDALADILWDHSDGGEIAFQPLPEAKVCQDCGDTYINWGAHAERCTGRLQQIDPRYMGKYLT